MDQAYRREIAKRGCKAVGLDSAAELLRYSSEKAKEEGVQIETVQVDMSGFGLEKKVDFAFIMMGSLVVESNEKFMDHLNSVACSLKRGGLCFMQNKAVDWARSAEQNWTMEKEWKRGEDDLQFHLLEGHTESDLHGKRRT